MGGRYLRQEGLRRRLDFTGGVHWAQSQWVPPLWRPLTGLLGTRTEQVAAVSAATAGTGSTGATGVAGASASAATATTTATTTTTAAGPSSAGALATTAATVATTAAAPQGEGRTVLLVQSAPGNWKLRRALRRQLGLGGDAGLDSPLLM